MQTIFRDTFTSEYNYKEQKSITILKPKDEFGLVRGRGRVGTMIQAEETAGPGDRKELTEFEKFKENQ